MKYYGVIEVTMEAVIISVFNDENKLEDTYTEQLYIPFDKEKGTYHILPEQVITLVVKCLFYIVEIYKGKELNSFGLSVMKDSALCFERSTGRAFGELLLADDRRATQQYLTFIANSDKSRLSDLREKTGVQLHSRLTAIKFVYLINHTEEVIQELRSYNQDLIFCTLDTFIIYRLTGQLLTSATIAGTTFLVNIKNNPYVWDQQLVEMFGLKQKWLPFIRPTAYQYGRIDLNATTTGFYKKNDTEYFNKAQKSGISNIFITDYLLDTQITSKIDKMEYGKDDRKNKSDKTSEVDNYGQSQQDVFEKVEAVKNFSEDIPNMYISNYKCSQKFNERTKITGNLEELKMYNKIRNMNLYIDTVSYVNCFSMVGHNCISKEHNTLVLFHDKYEIMTYLGSEFIVSNDLDINTAICYDYIEYDYDWANSFKLQYYVTNLYQKDSPGYTLFDFYSKPYAHRNYWKVNYMHTIQVDCEKVFDRIIKTLNIGKHPKEVAEYLNLVTFDKKQNLIYINKYDKDFYFNLNQEHNLYHMSRAMLESITYEMYMKLDKVMKSLNIDLFKEQNDTKNSQPEYDDLKVVVDGKYCKCDSLMKEYCEILNRRLYYYNTYTVDNMSEYIGMITLQTYISNHNAPVTIVEEIYKILKVATYIPTEVRIGHEELSKLETSEEIKVYMYNKKLKINKAKIDQYKKVVNMYLYNSFKYVKTYMKHFVQDLFDKKEVNLFDMLQKKELTMDVNDKLEDNLLKNIVGSAKKLKINSLIKNDNDNKNDNIDELNKRKLFIQTSMKSNLTTERNKTNQNDTYRSQLSSEKPITNRTTINNNIVNKISKNSSRADFGKTKSNQNRSRLLEKKSTLYLGYDDFEF